jgi:hypothetical protein
MLPPITWSADNARELAIVFLPWQQWTKTILWLDNVGISAFHSCVVVDLWQSLPEWRLLLSECVLCAVARMWELLFKLRKSGREIRAMLVQVYGDNVT